MSASREEILISINFFISVLEREVNSTSSVFAKDLFVKKRQKNKDFLSPFSLKKFIVSKQSLEWLVRTLPCHHAITTLKHISIRIPRKTISAPSQESQFSTVLFFAQDKHFFHTSRSSIIVHDHDYRIFTDIFESKIFLTAGQWIHSDIQARNPGFLAIDSVVVEVCKIIGMIFSLQYFKRFIWQDQSIDGPGSRTNASTLDHSHTSHICSAIGQITFAIVYIGIIMDLVHKGDFLAGIDDSDISDIPKRDGDIIRSPRFIRIYSRPVRTHHISQILQILLTLKKIDFLQTLDLFLTQNETIRKKACPVTWCGGWKLIREVLSDREILHFLDQKQIQIVFQNNSRSHKIVRILWIDHSTSDMYKIIPTPKGENYKTVKFIFYQLLYHLCS